MPSSTILQTPPDPAGALPSSRASRTETYAWLGCGLATALAWGLTWLMSRGMGAEMRMGGGWRMSMVWAPMQGQSELAAALMFLAMWECMMVAMMLLSALPVLMLSAQVARRSERSAMLAAVVGAGYFASWMVFGVGVYAGGRLLGAAAMHWERFALNVPLLTGLAVLIAGAYQLTPWKNACLRHCRSPLSLMAQRWRPGWRGALRTGFHHGNYCVACCWSLMAVQCVLGLMSLPLMAAIATVIAAEKLIPRGRMIAVTAGAAFIVSGAAMIYH